MVEMVEVPLMRSPHALEGSWEGRSLQQSPKLPRGHKCRNPEVCTEGTELFMVQ